MQPLTLPQIMYLALVQSTLDDSAVIWDPHLQKDIDQLERVQRRSARFITGDYSSRDQGSITRMLDNLELTPLQDRRRSAQLAYFYKVAEGLCQQCQVMTS